MANKKNEINMIEAEIEMQSKKILNYVILMLEEAWDTPPSEERLLKLSHIEYCRETDWGFIREVAKNICYSDVTVYQILRGKQKPSLKFCLAVIGFWNSSPGRLSGKSCEPNVLISMREKLSALEDRKKSALHTSAADAFLATPKKNKKGVA